jgi:protein TonB
VDSPWQRLPWTLPGAILLSSGLLLVFLRVIAGPPHAGSRSAVLDARIVEIPGPSEGARQENAPQEPITAPKPPEPNLVQRRERIRPAQPERPRLPPKAAEESAHEGKASESESAAPAADAGSRAPETPGAGLGGGKLSARALFKPLPEIPEALRRQKIEVVAVARFAVAADGSSVVELVQPTDDPALNRSLIDALRRWRFFPAIEEGRPVASSVEIRIPISVR